MTYSVDKFQAEVIGRGGPALSNLWKVTLPSLGVYDTKSIDLICRSTGTPGRNINQTELAIGMSRKQIANGYGITPIPMTFLVLNDPYILEYFEVWQNLCINQQTYEVGYYSEYTFPVKIDILKKGFAFPLYKKDFNVPLPTAIKNRLPTIGPINFAQGQIDLNILTDDKIVYQYELIEAYPSAFTGMSLTNDPNSNLLELNVEFSYRDWRSAALSEKGENIFGEIIDNLTGGLFDKLGF
jgi:hypothetical protein